jgi:hypothetical protein
MPQSVISGSNSTFVNHIFLLDNDMTSRMREEGKSSNDIYQMYLERLSLHEKACLFPLSEPDKVILQAKKEDIYVDFKLFTLKQEVKKQLDEIKTTLYDLKNFES